MNRAPNPSSGGMRILLVEDDAFIAALTAEFLALSGHRRVSRADCVARALDLLGRAEFDLAITDLGLPDASRVSAVADLRRAAPGLPVVVLSGSEHLADEALRAGARMFVPKGDLLRSRIAAVAGTLATLAAPLVTPPTGA